MMELRDLRGASSNTADALTDSRSSSERATSTLDEGQPVPSIAHRVNNARTFAIGVVTGNILAASRSQTRTVNLTQGRVQEVL